MNFLMVQLSSVEEELSTVGLAASAIPDAASLIDKGWQPGFLGSYFFVVLPDSDDSVTRIRARMVDWAIGEDPATGSAACTLACYLSSRLGIASQGHTYMIEQGVEKGRRSLIQVRIDLNTTGEIKRVRLSGKAVKVQEGRILA